MAERSVDISVRKIVEFVLKCGSIDHTYTSSTRAQDGTRVHQKLQKSHAKLALLQGYTYEKEVFLSVTENYKDFDFIIEGRADGIIHKDDFAVVEEIKSTIAPVEFMEKNTEHWHWAQAKFYAYMLGKKENLSEIKIVLTYCNIETNDEVSFEEIFSFEEISSFFFEILDKYYKWAEMDYKRKFERNNELKEMSFPFSDYRKGQRSFSVYVYRAIQNRLNLYAQAPTGTGKTMSTLFPATKAISEGFANKIFYLTAKTITRQTAEDSIYMLNKTAPNLFSLTLTAKDKLCFNYEQKCNPDDCIYAKGHFDRVNDAVWDIINNLRSIKRKDIEEYSLKHNVCPHEFMLDISLWADIIIGDYNYVFDPKIQLKRFFADVSSKDQYVFLVDEAHNLVDRAREMYSKTLYKRDFMKLRKSFKDKNYKLHKILNDINKFYLELNKTYFDDPNENVVFIDSEPEDFNFLLHGFVAETDKYLAAGGDNSEDFENLLEQYFNVLDYLRISELFSEKYIFYMEKDKKDFSVKLFCLDPSENLAEVQKNAVSTCFYSATLTPITYFMKVFGGDSDDYGLKIGSPFPEDNLCLIIENRISTKYKQREESYEKIATVLYEMINSKKGNYIVFFPSYKYLLSVYDAFMLMYTDVHILVQNRNMSEDDREGFLQNFENVMDKSMLAFAVMGGIFAEGIDLKGEKLSGVAVVGVGLPLLTRERDVISNYYSETVGKYRGFDYAYVFPGMNKVMQSAGRVIRTEKDRGCIILIDDRFATDRYLNLFPGEWNKYVKTSEKGDVKDILADFWKEK